MEFCYAKNSQNIYHLEFVHFSYIFSAFKSIKKVTEEAVFSGKGYVALGTQSGL